MHILWLQFYSKMGFEKDWKNVIWKSIWHQFMRIRIISCVHFVITILLKNVVWKWYFVSKIVLTYYEKKFFHWNLFFSGLLRGQEEWIKKKVCKIEAEGRDFVMFSRFTSPPDPSVFQKETNYSGRIISNSKRSEQF